jgi:polynucleotide 5'-hydroxyl-kinase GRC3/NOL9
MSEDWAGKIAERLLGRGLMQPGICMILGAADTGKTTLAAALAGRLAADKPVGVVDADVGQSHIGPPATVGWAIVDKPVADLAQLVPGGISFVGDVTPVGHLLQLTAAVMQCVRQASKVTEQIIVDTPGLVAGPAAAALWWTVQRILQPTLILAVQRASELSDILAGLPSVWSRVELIKCADDIPAKSPQTRRSYRQNQFRRYFQGSCLYNIDLSDIAVRTTRKLSGQSMIGRLVGLGNEEGIDLAVGLVEDWQGGRGLATVRAPEFDASQIRCIVVGDVTIDLGGG